MLRRVVGNGLRVIAGRGGDQSALLFLGSQRQDAVERPSFLVGSGSLQVFKFQKDGIPRLRRKCLRAPAGRDKNRAPNPLARPAYLFEGHHENPSYYTSTSGGNARNTIFFSLSTESVPQDQSAARSTPPRGYCGEENLAFSAREEPSVSNGGNELGTVKARSGSCFPILIACTGMAIA